MAPKAWGDEPPGQTETIKLPQPRLRSSTSIEEALLKRRSVREYEDSALTLAEVSQLLWAAQGVTDTMRGFRTAPSAGALYPLEVYVVVGKVDGLAEGVYKYVPSSHQLTQVGSGDRRDKLSDAALEQESIAMGAIDIVFASVYQRCAQKYGERASLYVPIEVGHAAQNVLLQAVALELGAVVMGAFYDDKVKSVIGMADDEVPLYIIPVGRE